MTYRIILKDAFKQYKLDQDKIMPPDETVKRFKEKLKKVHLDILDNTKRIDKGRLGIPVFFSVCGKDARKVMGTKKQMGKGATPEQAEASAVMELAERFSFFSFSQNPENFLVETHRNLKGKALSFDMICQSVHDDSRDLDAARKIFEHLPLRWTRAFNLTQEKDVFIPFDWFFAINEFNGPSAGNSPEEAICQGLCEIVERHVSAIVSRKKLSVPGINPDSVLDSTVWNLVKKYRAAGIEFHLSDFSLDTGIPSVAMLAFDPQTFPERSEIVWTAGTTPNPQKALSRALTEVAQLAGDFDTSSKYVPSGLPKVKTLQEVEFITRPAKEISISDLPDISDDNIKTEIENGISALARKKMNVIVVNTTHPLLEIPAFYTIIPGAHFRERTMGTSVGMFTAKLITEKNDPQQAITALKHMESLLTGKYYIQFYLGLSYLSLGDPQTAVRYFTRALELEPNDQDIPSIYAYMGVCFKDLGQYRKALDMLKIGETYDRERTDFYNLMGFCHYKLKAHSEAIECFKKVIAIDPTSAIDYANIASNYREMGQKEKAIHYYELALSLDPGIGFALENLLNLRLLQR